MHNFAPGRGESKCNIMSNFKKCKLNGKCIEIEKYAACWVDML